MICAQSGTNEWNTESSHILGQTAHLSYSIPSWCKSSLEVWSKCDNPHTEFEPQFGLPMYKFWNVCQVSSSYKIIKMLNDRRQWLTILKGPFKLEGKTRFFFFWTVKNKIIPKDEEKLYVYIYFIFEWFNVYIYC